MKISLKQNGRSTLFLAILLFIGSQAYAAQTITFYHNDVLGSPVAATDENGNICWREDYQPYGEKLENNDGHEPSTAGCGLDDNQRGYTGHVHDKDIGLTYMQARYYDPVVGRFMGVDPVGPVLSRPASFNRYAYGNNNPYKYVDPDGMEADDHHGGDDGDPLGSFGNYQDANSMHGFNDKGADDLDDFASMVNDVTDYVPSPKSLLSRIAKRALKSGTKRGRGQQQVGSMIKTDGSTTASAIKAKAESVGFKPTQTPNGPLKMIDENGVARVTIKGGSQRAPGSAGSHVELKTSSGQRVNPAGQSVTRKSPENHTSIINDL
ncbi:MAG: hypothetical protein GY820_11640 [Gammaproteobacteria bacterium]|nr:hypothetical protein [Gammaproteobacteria bacterium]